MTASSIARLCKMLVFKLTPLCLSGSTNEFQDILFI